MSETLARRGPYHAGTYADGPVAFGHRRNGTIYNYREPRAELISMGHTFVSEGDSEVILKAYAAWGEQCVQRFYGMFVFAIWDMLEAARSIAYAGAQTSQMLRANMRAYV